MDNPLAPQPKNVLTPEAFASFLVWLSPNQEQAARKYLDLRQEIVKLFIRKGCGHAEDLTDRTLDRVVAIAHFEPIKYSSPISLCCGVARNVWLEYLREKVHEPLQEDCFPAPKLLNEDFTEQEDRCLSSCLDLLSLLDRELIFKYHQFQGREKIEARKQLANAHGGLNKLRITTHRIRMKLHHCITGCVQRSAYN